MTRRGPLNAGPIILEATRSDFINRAVATARTITPKKRPSSRVKAVAIGDLPFVEVHERKFFAVEGRTPEDVTDESTKTSTSSSRGPRSTERYSIHTHTSGSTYLSMQDLYRFFDDIRQNPSRKHQVFAIDSDKAESRFNDFLFDMQYGGNCPSSPQEREELARAAAEDAAQHIKLLGRAHILPTRRLLHMSDKELNELLQYMDMQRNKEHLMSIDFVAAMNRTDFGEHRKNVLKYLRGKYGKLFTIRARAERGSGLRHDPKTKRFVPK